MGEDRQNFGCEGGVTEPEDRYSINLVPRMANWPGQLMRGPGWRALSYARPQFSKLATVWECRLEIFRPSPSGPMFPELAENIVSACMLALGGRSLPRRIRRTVMPYLCRTRRHLQSQHWRSLGDSNPCFRRERAARLEWLVDIVASTLLIPLPEPSPRGRHFHGRI